MAVGTPLACADIKVGVIQTRTAELDYLRKNQVIGKTGEGSLDKGSGGDGWLSYDGIQESHVCGSLMASGKFVAPQTNPANIAMPISRTLTANGQETQWNVWEGSVGPETVPIRNGAS